MTITEAGADDLIGQDRVLGWLDDAAARPVHAYLVVGPRGSSTEHVARRLAGLLIAADDRARSLIARGVHADVVEFRPPGATYKVDDIRKTVIPATMSSPVEGDRKVVILYEAERLSQVSNLAPANAFLKTLEEPAPRTVLILVTSAADDVLLTIRSRCSRLDLDPVAGEVITAALEASGATAADAARATLLAGGQVQRARRLLADLAPIRAAFAAAPGRLDGSGATVAVVAAQLDAVLVEWIENLEVEHTRELADFDAEMDRQGYEPRQAKRLRKAIKDQQARVLRRARIDLMMEGVTAIESVIFDCLSGGEPRNDDVSVPAWSPRRSAAALDACRRAREALATNEKGTLHLEHLLLTLSRAR